MRLAVRIRRDSLDQTTSLAFKPVSLDDDSNTSNTIV